MDGVLCLGIIVVEVLDVVFWIVVSEVVIVVVFVFDVDDDFGVGGLGVVEQGVGIGDYQVEVLGIVVGFVDVLYQLIVGVVVDV